MGGIVEILIALEKGPMFHYEFNPDAYMQVMMVLHELSDLGILENKMEKGRDRGSYDSRFYLTDIGKNLLNNLKNKKAYEAYKK